MASISISSTPPDNLLFEMYQLQEDEINEVKMKLKFLKIKIKIFYYPLNFIKKDVIIWKL